MARQQPNCRDVRGMAEKNTIGGLKRKESRGKQDQGVHNIRREGPGKRRRPEQTANKMTDSIIEEMGRGFK